MKVNLSIEVTDEQRNVLAIINAGKPTKALATRDDVRAFVEGCLDFLKQQPTAEPEPQATAPAPSIYAGDPPTFWDLLTPEELKLANKFKAEGKPDGFIRGYFFIERNLRSAHRARPARAKRSRTKQED
jgi:hypothetical protein